MVFYADRKKRKKVKDELAKTNKVVKGFVWVTRLIPIVTIVSILFTYVTDERYWVTYNKLTGELDYLWLDIMAGDRLVACLALWIISYAATQRMKIVFLGDRVGETVEIQENILFYAYRFFYQNGQNTIEVFFLNLDTIRSLQYDEQTKKLIIEADGCSETTYETGFDKPDEKDMTPQKVEFIDYYEPSLYKYIRKYQERRNANES